ncbi:peptide ABC transporter substrate-binding protein [Bacillus manliponensis]|uniref:Peptide ABC transporter substrate-binding protein n=1 Tax=Bacillus manliponensis TaxID=574376 RepID=A0A073JV13_9BACI|nr:ABC transporter substrate-binding protein [Bacillus manliponensis]KEK18021.1 peptide ABC transporter substrate-binding protein [Bacillus manliponensis]
MKRKLATVSFILFLLIGLVACSGGKEKAKQASSNSTSETGSPKDGGTLTIGVSDNPDAMNPLYANDRVSLTIQQALYAPLYHMHNGEKKFVLAESFTPSEDQLTWTLKLKDNLKWHDGQKITADDIVFTVESILDEKQSSSRRENFIFKGQPVQVEKVDELTAQFVLPQVSASFEGVLNDFFPIPKHVFENETDLMKSEKNNHPIGSGPFKFKEFKTDEYVVLERFDDYFAGKPKLDSVVYRVVKDRNTANVSLQNGQINMKMIEPQDYKKLNETDKFSMVLFPEERLFYMSYNLNNELMQKKEVRQAIAHALDKKEMIQSAFVSDQFAEPAHSILTPGTLHYSSDVKKYKHDQKKAKALLKEAGVKENETVRVMYVTNNKVMESLALYTQQKLKEVGLEVELLALDASAASEKSLDKENKDYDITFGGYIMGPEPDVYKSLYLSDAEYNYARYKNAELDQLWADAAVETDKEKRAKLYHEIQKTIAEDVPYFPIAYPKAVIAVDKKYGGLEEAHAIPVTMFEDLSKIYEVQ